MAEILLSLPSAYKQEIKSDAFRRRTKEKFRELYSLKSSWKSSNNFSTTHNAPSGGSDIHNEGGGGQNVSSCYVKGTLSLTEVLPMVHGESVYITKVQKRLPYLFIVR